MSKDEEEPGRANDVHDNGDQGRGHQIEIEVNGRRIVMNKGEATGLEIKEAAVAQGSPIQVGFVLQLEQANGTSKVIGNDDKVKLHEKMSFTAIAADDNS